MGKKPVGLLHVVELRNKHGFTPSWVYSFRKHIFIINCFCLSGPSLVGVVRKDWASQTSVALSWQETEQPHAAILDYEIKYYEKVIEVLFFSNTEDISYIMNCRLNEVYFIFFLICLGTRTVKLFIYTDKISKCDSDRTEALHSLCISCSRSNPRRLQQLQPQV